MLKIKKKMLWRMKIKIVKIWEKNVKEDEKRT